MIKWEQIVFEGNPQYGVDIHPIDFAMFALSCGVAGYSLDSPADVEKTIRQALSIQGPALIDALIDPYEAPMPGHVTSEQAWHFAEAMLRGDKDRWNIIKTVVKNQIRRVF